MNIHTEILRRVRDAVTHPRSHIFMIMGLFACFAVWSIGPNVLQGSLLGGNTRVQQSAATRRAARLTHQQSSNPSLLGGLLSMMGTTQESAPAFGRAVFPVDRVPNWGAMRSPAEWNRTFAQMTAADFVPVPAYNLATLTIPMDRLTHPITTANIPMITAKLFYSTRYFAAYNLDADEFTGNHSGVDLKLPMGTPIHAIGGGTVQFASNDGPLGLHIMIMHQLNNGERYYSLYAHLSAVNVGVGDVVTPGQTIGAVGMTGDTTGPHLHFQIDTDDGSATHTPFEPILPPTKEVAAKWSVNPITFVQDHANADW